MQIIESIDRVLNHPGRPDRARKAFGRLRSAMSSRPIDLDEAFAALTLIQFEDPDYYEDAAIPYYRDMLRRTPGLEVKDAIGDDLPVIINLENTNALTGDLSGIYIAKIGKKVHASASSLQGMIDALFEKHPSGLAHGPMKSTVVAYDRNRNLIRYTIVHSTGKPLYKVEQEWLEAAFK
jgi:hypothetical protein